MQFSSMEFPARVLGLTPGSNGWWNGRCPHPDHEDLHPSFSARFDAETGQFITYCQVCSNQKAVRQSALKKLEDAGICGCLDSGAVHTVMASPTPEAKKVFLREKALDIWEDADFKTDVVEKYLQGRGIFSPVPASIRQSTLPYTLGSGVLYPCMVAEVTDSNCETVGIHRTYLEQHPDGTITKAKVPAPKKSLGSIKGHHIRLSDEYLGTLHLTEGIETGLAVREALSASVWACISAQNLAAIIVPDGFDTIFIWADKDRSGTGEKFAELVADRLTQQGKKVFILTPDAEIPEGKKGIDWLDLGHDAIVSAFAKVNAPETPISLPTPTPTPGEPWEHLQIPQEYRMDHSGVYREKISAKGLITEILVATGPLWISGRRIDLTTDETEIEITWIDQAGKLNSRWLSRGFAFRAATILEMAELTSFPVFDGVNREVVRFLALFEKSNGTLPTQLIARRPGWNLDPDGKSVFVLDREDSRIQLHPEPAYTPYMDALSETGSFSRWLEVVRPLASRFPVVLFALLAVLAPPLLKLLGVQNFIIDLNGRTSVGKTTLLIVIASVWGKPSGQSGLILSWNNTAIFSERIATFFGQGLPIFFDDSQTALEKVIELILYMLSNGRGRGLGKPYSVKTVNNFIVVLFTTGERPLTEKSFPGAKARTISINGSPFPGIDPKELSNLKAVLSQNYGHLARLFTKSLSSISVDELVECYEQWLDQFLRMSKTEIAYRYASYFAAIRVVAHVMLKIEAMEWVRRHVLEAILHVWEHATSDIAEVDMATKALHGLAAWIESNKRHFAIAGTITELQPTYGKILRDEGYVAIPPFIFQRALAELGIQSSAAVIAEWKRQGYLIHSPSRNHHQVKIEGRPVWCFCIKLDALFAQEGDGVLTQTAPTDANQLAQNQLPN